MSKFFSKSKSLREAWHRELLSNDLAGQLSRGQLGELPASVHHLTEAYLDRKKLLPCTTECETCLMDLMVEHFGRNGSPHLAFLACIRFYSRSMALVILAHMRDGVQHLWIESSYTKYLHCLVLINKIIPAYVLDAEKSVAAKLWDIHNRCPEPLLVFRRVVRELAALPSSPVLPTEYVNELLHCCGIRKSIEAYLKYLQSDYRWAELHDFISWVSKIGQPHQCPLAHDVMREQIPLLNAWITWRPNPKFLVLEASQLSPVQLSKLRPILALEGPDTTDGSQHGTLKEAEPAALQATSVRPPELHLAVKLQSLFAGAMKLGSQLRPAALDMLISLCVDRPATSTSIAFADRVLCTKNSECYNVAKIIAAGMAPPALMTTRMATIERVLPILVTNPDASELFFEDVISAIEPTMRAAQEMYRRQLAIKLGDSFGYNIQAYGNTIRRATWLHLHLEPDFVAKIQRFPPDDVLGGIIGRAQSASTLPAKTEEAMRQYLLAALCSTGTEDQIAEHKVEVDADLEFWITHPEIERNRVMMAIRNLYSAEDPEYAVFLRACRQQIPHEDIVLLRDMLPLIERNSYVSCGELLQVVARRMRLHMGIDDVWVSLALLMLEQRADNVLDWACNDLPIEPLLSWVANVQLLATRRPVGGGPALLYRIGLTPRRLEWFAILKGPYYRAASYLDRLQRRDNQGRSSLKWLYLQEMPNVAALLDAIVDSQLLGYEKEWILCFYDGTLTSMSNICDFVQSGLSCGPYGRTAIRTILKRFYETEWPENAAQAYVMAWMRSGKLTKADTSALKALLQVVDLKPAQSMSGVKALRDQMLRDYDLTMQLAREVERLRVQLSQKDPQRADALAARLGMKEVQPYVDAAVPPDLSDVTESVGNSVYEMYFPLTHLDENDMKVRGISRAFLAVSVRVSLTGEDRSRHGFCVHMLQHSDLARQDSQPLAQLHDMCHPRGGPPTSRLCSVTLNMFTHALVQRLWRLFLSAVDRKPVSLKAVHAVVTETIKRPGAECTACGDALVSPWRPTICTKPACYKQHQQLSLYIRCHGLLIDAPVLDFLLCCLYAVTQSPLLRGQPLLTEDFPLDWDELANVIDSFPPLRGPATTGPWQLLQSIREGDVGQKRATLLAWMSKWFRGCMLTAPPGKRLAVMSNVEQFVLLNSTPECEEAFATSTRQQEAAAAASSSSWTGGRSKVVFHGSQASHMWRVLTEGLRNMSNTAYMRHGAKSGPGIYLADEPATSFPFCGSLGTSWKHSAFSYRRVLLGCELADTGADTGADTSTTGRTPPAGTHIVTDASRVLVRYVFLCPGNPGNYQPPPARHLRPAMQTTFAALRAGPA